ncbi:pilin [Phytohabitans suffuscus]|nr:pilin [Phytohabitans suffuscus]
MIGKLRPHPRGEPAHSRGRPAAARLAHRALRLLRVFGVLATAVAATLLVAAGSAYAAEPVEPTVTSLDQVIDNIRLWLLGILAAWATFCLVVGFFRYTSGDQDEVEKGKVAFRSAGIGYAGALLAPLLVTIFGEWLTS